MTPAELELRGKLLYGRQWRKDMANNLGVYPSTVRRWKIGKCKINPNMEKKITELMAKRVIMIRSLIASDSKESPKKTQKCFQCEA